MTMKGTPNTGAAVDRCHAWLSAVREFRGQYIELH